MSKTILEKQYSTSFLQGMHKHPPHTEPFESKSTYRQPEKRLLLAILVQAIRDITGDPTQHSRVVRISPKDTSNALEWILDDDKFPDSSFRWCCESLGLNVDIVKSWAKENINGRKNNESILQVR